MFCCRSLCFIIYCLSCVLVCQAYVLMYLCMDCCLLCKFYNRQRWSRLAFLDCECELYNRCSCQHVNTRGSHAFTCSDMIFIFISFSQIFFFANEYFKKSLQIIKVTRNRNHRHILILMIIFLWKLEKICHFNSTNGVKILKGMGFWLFWSC